MPVQSLQTYAAIATALAASVTGGFLIWYTIESYRLRKATQEQARATAALLKEARIQNEQGLLPVVALSVRRETTRVGYGATLSYNPSLKARNLGTGPAVNISMSGIIRDDTRWVFRCVRDLAIGEEAEVFSLYRGKSEHSTPSSLNAVESSIIEDGLIDFPTTLIVKYQNANGVRYKAKHLVLSDGKTIDVSFSECEKG